MRLWVKHGCALGSLLAVALAGTPEARASLGGDAASIATDAQLMHGVEWTTTFQDHEVHEIASDSGLRVREFLSRSGVVFGIAWSAPFMPDLRQLLGEHFARFTRAAAAVTQGGVHRSLRTADPQLVVETGGHMRAVTGRAFLPELAPAGFSIADLR